MSESSLLQSPLHRLHCELGGKMVAFAGYHMPLQFTGIRAEHLHTRAAAGLFDVSHMGQLLLQGPQVSADLERLLPIDCEQLSPGQQSYTVMCQPDGGIIDDLIVSRLAEQEFMLVVNAARKRTDIGHIREHLHASTAMRESGNALLALQGPAAQSVLLSLIPELESLSFMRHRVLSIELDRQLQCIVSRSGYTGEDGFELSVPAESAERLAQHLLENDKVQPVGLGARDSLRLEAGLCLYGNDLDEQTNPVQAGLSWTIAKSRRYKGAKEGNFIGADAVLAQLSDGAPRKRVGLAIAGKAPLRRGIELMNSDGEPCGEICSGGFSPSLNKPVAMAYVSAACSAIDTALNAELRGRTVDAKVCALPFVPHQYRR